MSTIIGYTTWGRVRGMGPVHPVSGRQVGPAGPGRIRCGDSRLPMSTTRTYCWTCQCDAGRDRAGCGAVLIVETALDLAERDLEADRAACTSHRGYSDRAVCSIDECGILHYLDGDTVWPAHGRGCGAVRVDPSEVRS